jgi:hypothetical protein
MQNLLLTSVLLVCSLLHCTCLRDGPLQTIQQPQLLGNFPAIERIWEGGNFTYLGSGIYYKKILFISVQVSCAGRVTSMWHRLALQG